LLPHSQSIVQGFFGRIHPDWEAAQSYRKGLLKSFDRRCLSGLPSVTIMCKAAINPNVLLPRRSSLFLALISILVALSLPLCAASQSRQMPRAQKHEGHHEIFQLEEIWRNAILKGDVAAMDSLLSDDYTAITPNGTLQSKEQALANLRSGVTHFSAITLSDRRVRFYGRTALVTSMAEVSGSAAGRDFSGSYRYTRVYVRNTQGQWKIVSFEASRIRPPGEPR
jgi:ketosteroid isomerase-like protein